jgi:hypothetical protein
MMEKVIVKLIGFMNVLLKIYIQFWIKLMKEKKNNKIGYIILEKLRIIKQDYKIWEKIIKLRVKKN